MFSKRPKEILAFTINLGPAFVRDPNGTDGWLGHRAFYLCVVLTGGEHDEAANGRLGETASGRCADEILVPRSRDQAQE